MNLLAVAALFTSTHAAESNTAAVGRLDLEISFFTHKLVTDPKSFMMAKELGAAYNSKARLTGSLADYRLAEGAFRQSLKIQPEHNSDAVFGLATTLSSQHKFKEAKGVLVTVLSEAAVNPTITAVLGDVAYELGDYMTAEESYAKFAVEKPGMAAWSRLAKVHLLHGRWDEADALWNKCVKLPVGSNPEPSAWASVMYGDLYLRKGEVPQARAHFLKSLEILPGYPIALEHLAETYEIEGDDKSAAPLLDSALSQIIHHDLIFRRADISERMGDKVHAARLRDSAHALLSSEIAAGDVGHRRVLAEYLLKFSDRKHEAWMLAKAEAADRGDIETDMLMARALFVNGNIGEAVKYADRALRFGSYEPHLYKYAVQIYESANLPSKADECRAMLAKLNPTQFGESFAAKSASK